jgi:hypothetical protein
MSQAVPNTNDGATEFPGFVTRQSLVDFCREKVAEIDRNQKQLENVLDFSKFSKNGNKVLLEFGSDEGVLHEAYSANIGEQRAYRAICDWAGSHNVPPSPVEIRQPDTDLPKETELERTRTYETLPTKMEQNNE